MIQFPSRAVPHNTQFECRIKVHHHNGTDNQCHIGAKNDKKVPEGDKEIRKHRHNLKQDCFDESIDRTALRDRTPNIASLLVAVEVI